MGLENSLSIATGGLTAISAALALVSQNVSNASTPDYALEVGGTESLDAGSLPLGTRSTVPQLASDPALQNQLSDVSAEAAGNGVTSDVLAGIDAALGTVGNNDDLGSQLTALQDSFSSLLSDPASQTQQGAVVTAAANLANGINSLASTYSQAQQTAQDNIVTEVGQLNNDLSQIGTLNAQIIPLKAQGQSTADLENQRNVLTADISQLVNARYVESPDGDLQVLTADGTQLPTTQADPLSIANATTASSVYYPGGGLPGIELDGSDISEQFSAGQISANLRLRNTTLPTYASELDEFAHTLASRFDAQGLTLFTNSAGVLPVSTTTPAQSGYLGFASEIQVNPQVLDNPALVRDGTRTVAAGDPGGGAPFTPNPTGLGGFTTLINNVLTYTFGDDSQAGQTQPAPAISGLGASGTLSAPFGTPATLSEFATDLTASQAADSENASNSGTETTALQTALQNKLTGETGVSLDTEMSDMIALQNAYAANAKIITSVQGLFADVIGMVQ
jgi:flagellar hook-associated protein 1 FlgK